MPRTEDVALFGFTLAVHFLLLITYAIVCESGAAVCHEMSVDGQIGERRIELGIAGERKRESAGRRTRAFNTERLVLDIASRVGSREMMMMPFEEST